MPPCVVACMLFASTFAMMISVIVSQEETKQYHEKKDAAESQDEDLNPREIRSRHIGSKINKQKLKKISKKKS